MLLFFPRSVSACSQPPFLPVNADSSNFQHQKRTLHFAESVGNNAILRFLSPSILRDVSWDDYSLIVYLLREHCCHSLCNGLWSSVFFPIGGMHIPTPWKTALAWWLDCLSCEMSVDVMSVWYNGSKSKYMLAVCFSPVSVIVSTKGPIYQGLPVTVVSGNFLQFMMNLMHE